MEKSAPYEYLTASSPYAQGRGQLRFASPDGVDVTQEIINMGLPNSGINLNPLGMRAPGSRPTNQDISSAVYQAANNLGIGNIYLPSAVGSAYAHRNKQGTTFFDKYNTADLLDNNITRSPMDLGLARSGNYGDAIGGYTANITPDGLVKSGISEYEFGPDSRSTIANTEINQNRMRAAGSGTLGGIGPLLKTIVPAAISAAATAGLGTLGTSLGVSNFSIPGLGNLPGASLDAVSGISGLQGPTQGSGFLGNIGKLSNLVSGVNNTGLTIGGQPMKLGSLLSAGGDIYGYMQGRSDIDEMENVLREQALRAEQQFQPFAQAGQNALSQLQAPNLEALQNDPGYQFRLQQGNQALERSLASRGLGQSGAALKAAQEYGQGLADQTYNDFFNRQMGIANQGFSAASGLGNIYAGLGNAQAAALRAQSENRNRLIGGLGGLFS